MSLAYAECPLDARESLAAQYFVDAIRYEDTQHSTMLMDAKDLKSALEYNMKYETARTVSKISRHVRTIEIEGNTSRERDDKFESLYNRHGEERDTDSRRGNPSVFSQCTTLKVMFCIGKRKKYYNIIPARSKCFIQGVPEISGQFRYTVTDLPSQVSQKGVLLAATLVDLKREAIPVRVLNLKNKPNILDKGDVIETREPVVDIFAHPQEFYDIQHLPSILEKLEILKEEQRRAGAYAHGPDIAPLIFGDHHQQQQIYKTFPSLPLWTEISSPD
ncbi:hypothetical protein AVEN_92097-1 [Araneus ventricosus]|uniref:Uncharacterized protein n=1 Tax=Araneus ventricosus TaxID=182803 RepID=A0A4Y2HHH7_ARAVE|nr:hypothetical protein AVEN_92097-1 [Araneus ventricosus]